jgi:hypothetical protein
VYYRISRVVACDKVRYDGLLLLLCLVEAAVCFSPAGAEEAREHSVDFLFHLDTEELGIKVDLLLEDIVRVLIASDRFFFGFVCR